MKKADGTTEQKPRNVRAIRDNNEKLLTDAKAIANTCCYCGRKIS